MKVFRDSRGFCHHLKLKRGDVSPHILTCGSPERVEAIGKKLKKAKVLSRNRGLVCLRGVYKDIDVTAVTSGMGPSSAAITLPEALDSVKPPKNGKVTLLRLGTAGSWQPYIKVGHLVVAKGSVRDEGAGEKWIPAAYPSVAGTKISLALLAAAERAGCEPQKNLWYGLIHVKDELYATESPHESPLGRTREEALSAYQRMGVLATEMEFGIVTLLADLWSADARKKKKGGITVEPGCILQILSPYGSHEAGEATTFEKIDEEVGINIALEALHLKARWDEGNVPSDALHSLVGF